MKRCIAMAAIFVAMNMGLYIGGSELKIAVTTVGDDSIVNAIKQHSDITQSYVNKWKPFGLWIVGPSLRSGVVTSIKKYIRVCKSLDLARIKFDSQEALMQALPINWTIGALCAAFKNLKEQGMYALTLLAQVSVDSVDNDTIEGLDAVIASYLSTIEHNKNLIKSVCDELIQKREVKRVEAVKLALDKATIYEKKAKSWSDRFGIAKVLLNPTSLKEFDPGVASLLGITFFLANKIGLLDQFNEIKESE